MRIPSLTSQVYTLSLNVGAPSNSSCLSTQADSPKDKATPAMVTVCAPARPISRPANPATSAAISGARTMMSSVCCISALHRIQLFHVDAPSPAEQHHQDGESDGRFGGRNRHDEEHEDLSVQIPEVARERHEIEVHRQQHQLDAHQQQNDVLAVEEHAGHGKREQQA